MFHAIGFERDVANGIQRVETALAIVMGDLTQSSPLLRSHLQCFTGEALGSVRCDCADQLAMAMQSIAEEGRGLVIYEYHEGRGIGLMAKMQTYELPGRRHRHRGSESCSRVQGRLQGFQLAGRDPA